jgi:hypothetical protein
MHAVPFALEKFAQGGSIARYAASREAKVFGRRNDSQNRICRALSSHDS